jgi:hypothetical protein
MHRKPNVSVIDAPTSSGHYTPEEEYKQLNTPRLLTALLKLKRLESQGEVKVEKSLDGTCEVYIMPLKDIEKSESESPLIHGSPWTLNDAPVSLDNIIQRLKTISEAQKEVSSPVTPPQKLQVSLDNCTLFYIPAETFESHEMPEGLPNSNENLTPTESYYNLASPHTLKFIQRALLKSSNSATPNSHDFIVQESLDKSIIIIHPTGTLPKGPNLTPVGYDMSCPDLAEKLKKRLEELTIQGEVKQAIDDENIQIITLSYSPCSFSGSQSSKENSTPIISRNDYPNLNSPKTNSKLLRKLHAVQEDLEGEDEGIKDIEGNTLYFEARPQPSHVFNYSLRNYVPTFQEVSEKLAKLKKRTYSC